MTCGYADHISSNGGPLARAPSQNTMKVFEILDQVSSNSRDTQKIPTFFFFSFPVELISFD